MNSLIFSLILASSLWSSMLLAQGERGSFAPGKVKDFRKTDAIKKNSDGSFTIINPQIRTNNGFRPLVAYPTKICQAFGFMGAIPERMKFKVTNNEEMLYLYTTVKTNTPSRIDPNEDISVSYQVKKSNASLQLYHQHYASEVVCANLRDVL